jgi:hypothetical protein
MRKSIGLFLERVNSDTIALNILPSNITVYITVLELSMIQKTEHENSSPMLTLEFIQSLSSRCINSSYAILTCIEPNQLATYIAVLSRDMDVVRKESEIVCSLITTLSQGNIICKVNSSDETVKILLHCLNINSISDRIKHFLKRDRNDINNNIASHPIPLIPRFKALDADEYKYLLEVFSKGTIKIGYLYSNPNIVVALSDEHISRHIAIVGSTGSGKSTTASILAREAALNGYGVVVIDWHGEYTSLIGDRDKVIYVNPIKGSIPEPLNMEEMIKVEPLAFIEIIESSLDLTPAQAHILEDAVNIASQRIGNGMDIVDVLIEIIQNSSVTARWFTESREALLRKLKPLSTNYLKIRWRNLKKVSIERSKIYIFDVSEIPNVRIKKIFASLLIRSIALKAQYNSIEKPILIIIDEAHNILSSDNPISNLIAEVRKWGIGFAIATQAPSMLAPMILKNVNTKIIHTIKSSSDIEAVLSTTILRGDHKKAISSLKPGEALITMPELVEPILIKIARL